MLGLGRILILDLVVDNLLVYSLPVMILLYLAAPFFTPKVFLDEIYIYTYIHTVYKCMTSLLSNYICIKISIAKSTLINCDIIKLRGL